MYLKAYRGYDGGQGQGEKARCRCRCHMFDIGRSGHLWVHSFVTCRRLQISLSDEIYWTLESGHSPHVVEKGQGLGRLIYGVILTDIRYVRDPLHNSTASRSRGERAALHTFGIPPVRVLPFSAPTRYAGGLPRCCPCQQFGNSRPWFPLPM